MSSVFKLSVGEWLATARTQCEYLSNYIFVKNIAPASLALTNSRQKIKPSTVLGLCKCGFTPHFSKKILFHKEKAMRVNEKTLKKFTF